MFKKVVPLTLLLTSISQNEVKVNKKVKLHYVLNALLTCLLTVVDTFLRLRYFYIECSYITFITRSFMFHNRRVN